MSYFEITTSCYDKYDYFHNTACCYRADIVSCEGETFTVEWTQGIPEGAEDKTANVKTSYGCGWCLAPFLHSNNVIMPFCPGAHVLVLNNNLSLNASEWSPDRFLIIGFDETFYTPGSNDALKPCTPNNLGFYFSNARYGAPYYIENNKDDKGQIECTPINPWTEGIIELPRGTENNHGEIITIALGLGELTAIKPFQVPGFDRLSQISDIVKGVGIRKIFKINNSQYSLSSFTVSPHSEVMPVSLQEKSYCFSTGTAYESIYFSQNVMFSPLFAGIYIGMGQDKPSPNSYFDLIYKNLVSYNTYIRPLSIPVYDGSDKYFNILLFSNPHISSVVTRVVNDTGDIEFSLSTTSENVGNFIVEQSGAYFNYQSFPGTYNYSFNIIGESSLSANGDGFIAEKSTDTSGTFLHIQEDNRVKDQYGHTIAGNYTYTTNFTESLSVDYTVGHGSWKNLATVDFNTNIVLNYPSRTVTGEGLTTVREEHTSVLYIDVRSGSLLTFRTVVSIDIPLDISTLIINSMIETEYDEKEYAATHYYMWPLWTVNYTAYIEFSTSNGKIILEEFSGSYDEVCLTDNIGSTCPYVNLFRPINSTVNSSLLLDCPYGPHASLLAIVSGGAMERLYDCGTNLFFLLIASSLSEYATISVAMDKRQVKIRYIYNGVIKTRYFVDNVELFERVNPESWNSTDILNR